MFQLVLVTPSSSFAWYLCASVFKEFLLILILCSVFHLGVLLRHKDAEGHVTHRWSSPMSTVPTTKLLFTQTKEVQGSGNESIQQR